MFFVVVGDTESAITCLMAARSAILVTKTNDDGVDITFGDLFGQIHKDLEEETPRNTDPMLYRLHAVSAEVQRLRLMQASQTVLAVVFVFRLELMKLKANFLSGDARGE